MASSAVLACVFGLLFVAVVAQDGASDSNSGYATYSNTDGGVCPGGASGLPGVSINAAQFGGGSACGQCVQIQGTGNGAGQNPVSTASYIAVITNVCPQCAPGDLDLQESGDGKYGITWSFVGCPGGGRRLIEEKEVSSEPEGTAEADSDAEPSTEEHSSQQQDAQAAFEQAQGVSSEADSSAVAGGQETAASVLSQAQPQTSRKLLRGQ